MLSYHVFDHASELMEMCKYLTTSAKHQISVGAETMRPFVEKPWDHSSMSLVQHNETGSDSFCGLEAV